MKLHVVVCFALLVVLTAGPAIAQKPPKVSNPVLRAGFVYCTVGDSACEAANRVRQDTPSDFVHGENSVSAQFQLGSGSRDLTIGLNTTSRGVFMDFTVQVHQGAVEPPFRAGSPVQRVSPYVNIRGAYFAKENCPETSEVCDYVTHAAMGNWRADGDNTDYTIFWYPAAPAVRPVNNPELTSEVNVRYYRNFNGTGEMFVITTIPKAGGYSLSGLEAKQRKQVYEAGQYDLPFTLTARFK